MKRTRTFKADDGDKTLIVRIELVDTVYLRDEVNSRFESMCDDVHETIAKKFHVCDIKAVKL